MQVDSEVTLAVQIGVEALGATAPGVEVLPVHLGFAAVPGAEAVQMQKEASPVLAVVEAAPKAYARQVYSVFL